MKQLLFSIAIILVGGCASQQKVFLSDMEELSGPLRLVPGECVTISDKTYEVVDPRQPDLALMRSTILPDLDFQSVPIQRVIEYLNKALSARTATFPCHIFLSLEGYRVDLGNGVIITEPPPITFRAHNISVFDALSVVKTVSDLRFTLWNKKGLLLYPRNVEL